MRVLLVEDDEPVAESLRRGLKRYGFEADRVTTGAAALTHTGPCDVVLVADASHQLVLEDVEQATAEVVRTSRTVTLRDAPGRGLWVLITLRASPRSSG